MEHPSHIPVLYDATLACVRAGLSGTGDTVADMTLGLAGHACGVIAGLGKNDAFVGFDADADNLAIARSNVESRFGAKAPCDARYVHANFRGAGAALDAQSGLPPLSAAYWDLGVSSAHYDLPERGFSFRFEGPLDMRFDRTRGLTARDVLATYREEDLVRIFSDYGEERHSKSLAYKIVQDRKGKGDCPFNTTGELAAWLDRVAHDPKAKTRVFQALRMEVNGELEAITTSLEAAFARLRPGGTLTVITFHSVEDRLVKRWFQKMTEAPVDPFTGRDASPALAAKLHKKPLEPSLEELAQNPRSRSAKLRAVRKN